MVGLGRWCEFDKQAVPKEICKAIRDSKVWQEDIDRLKQLKDEARGEDGNLSGPQVAQHKLKLLSIHRIKAKDGRVRLYWPEGTPTANAMKPTDGGKGKGGKQWKDKSYSKEDAESWEGPAKARSKNNRWNRSGNRNWKCWKCAKCGSEAPEMFVNRGGHWVCLNCEYDSDQSDSDPAEVVEMEDVQAEEISTGEAATGSTEVANLKGLQKQLVQQEELHAGLVRALPENHKLRVVSDEQLQSIKQAITDAKSRVRLVSCEDTDIKDKREWLKQALKSAKELYPAEGESQVGFVKLIEEELAQLQPKPQEPALHNQLTNARKALVARQEERAKLLVVKDRSQAQVEQLQASIAKLDRTMGKWIWRLSS